VGFIFPVKDNGKTRMAALYSGTVLTPNIVSNEGSDIPEIGRAFQGRNAESQGRGGGSEPLMDPFRLSWASCKRARRAI
jgi:hypothetical protein